MLEAAAVDGLGPWGVIRRVALPLSARALLAAWAVAFILGFGELPATNLLQPPGVTTITFRIWTLLHTGVESHLAGVALVTLGVITLLVLLMILAAWLSKSPPTGDQTCAPWIQAKQGRGCPETLSVISSAKKR